MADPVRPERRAARRRPGTRVTLPPVHALPDQSMHTLEAARWQEHVKPMATPGGSLDEASHHGASPLPCHEMDKDFHGFRDT